MRHLNLSRSADAEPLRRQGERNYIMQVVCEATQSPSSDVQVAAFECLVKIMHLYYEWMKFYMERALFGVSRLVPVSPVSLYSCNP